MVIPMKSMDSAPRDGTSILVLIDDTGQAKDVRWNNELSEHPRRGKWAYSCGTRVTLSLVGWWPSDETLSLA